jgi:hypothetical protein
MRLVSLEKLILRGRLSPNGRLTPTRTIKAQTQPETLENYLSITYPIALYPGPDGGYTVMMTDLVRCIS